MAELRGAVLEAVRTHGYRHFDEPIRLASGAESQDFIDAKRGLARGADLATACRAIVAFVEDDLGLTFDAVGGLTLGADQFSHGIAVLAGRDWFVVRKATKDRGTRQRIEGAPLGPGVRCLVVDDVVTTGGSLLEACEVVAAAGATVVAATALVDRGAATGERFAERGLRFAPLLTYADFGIPPVEASP